MPEGPVERLEEAPWAELETAAGTIRYREAGEGPPLLFVHGVFANGLLWRKVLPSLAGHARCIVPEWPLGSHTAPLRRDADLSPPALGDLVAEVAQRLGGGPVTLVGNDTGGALCQIAAARHPDVVARMVLTNCDAYENFPPRMFTYLKLSGWLPGGVALIAQGTRSRAMCRSPLAYGLLTKRPLDFSFVESCFRGPRASRGVRRDTAKVLRAMARRHTLAAAQSLRTLPAPVLLVWAQEDRVFPARYAQRLARDLPDARLVLVEDSLVFVPEDQPERLAGLVADFLTTAAPGPRRSA